MKFSYGLCFSLDLINGAQEQCELPPMDGFPHCEGKIKVGEQFLILLCVFYWKINVPCKRSLRDKGIKQEQLGQIRGDLGVCVAAALLTSSL